MRNYVEKSSTICTWPCHLSIILTSNSFDVRIRVGIYLQFAICMKTNSTKYFEHLQYPSFNSFEVLPFSSLKDDFRNTNFHIMWEIIVKGTRGGNQHLYHQQLLCDCDCYNHLLKIENEGVFNRYLQRCNFALLTKNKNHDYYMVKKCKSLGYISPTLKKFCRFC